MPAVRSGKRRIQRCGINATPFEHKERMPRHDGSRVWAFFIARRNTANSDSGKEPPRVVRQARTPLIFKHIHTALKRSLVLHTNKPSLHSKQALFTTKRSLVCNTNKASLKCGYSSVTTAPPRVACNPKRSKHFRQGEGKPNTVFTKQKGKRDEARHKQQESAQKGEHHSRTHTLNALEIADTCEIYDEKHKRDGD